MDALDTLMQEHRQVAELFAQAEQTEDDKKKKRIFEQISTALTLHMHVEETALYPALEQHEEFKDLAGEAVEEHRQVKTLMREIENLTDGSEKFDAKLKVMKENIEHHVEEEETEMFPQMRDTLPAEEFEQISQAMKAARTDVQKTSKARAGRK